MRTSLVVFGLAGLVLAFGLAGQAKATVSPFVPDANTMHLWHFDETPGTNAVDFGNSTTPIYLNDPSPSGQGAAAYPGFGTAFDAVASAVSLSPLPGSTSGMVGVNSSASTTPVNYNDAPFTGPDASFTYECYIRLNQISTVPYQGNGQAMILAHDGQNGSRGWDLKQIAGNVIQFCPAIGGNYDDNTQKVSFTIPASGPNAWTSNTDWFHLAVTFDGTSKLLSMYWTKLTATMTSTDNLVASQTLSGNPGASGSYFAVGASARAWPNRFIDGSIDEVRISDIARAADQMLNLGTVAWPNYLPGDFNKDGQVGPEDFGILKDTFGTSNLAHGNHESWTIGDANDDGQIGPEDFGLLKDSFGLSNGPTGTYPLANVPEPVSLAALLGLGLPVLLRRRSKTTGASGA